MSTRSRVKDVTTQTAGEAIDTTVPEEEVAQASSQTKDTPEGIVDTPIPQSPSDQDAPPKAKSHTGVDSTQNVRRMLSMLRTLWSQHAPSQPMYLGEDLGGGVTVSEFCVQFILSQRSRRVVRMTGQGVQHTSSE